MIVIENVGTYFFHGHVNNPDSDSTYGMNAYLNFFIEDIIYTMTGPGKPNQYVLMNKSLNVNDN